jgi:hypothetical protein
VIAAAIVLVSRSFSRFGVIEIESAAREEN